jgi:phosphatidylinositol glycan class B
MTALPFAATALYLGAASSFGTEGSLLPNTRLYTARSTLTWMAVFVVSSLSFISHKEARFLYPLLSPLLVLAGQPLARFVRNFSAWKAVILLTLLSFNIAASIYATQVHQRGVIDVLDYLRSQHEQSLQRKNGDSRTTVAFLMPCHSTPWRSHLIYPGIDAWALSCEPPLNVPFNERSSYVDEADMFYASPVMWLKTQMEDLTMRFGHGGDLTASIDQQTRNVDGRVIGSGRSWPDYLVTFAGLETTLEEFLKNTPYQVCKRLFNTHAHDDWRRKGDVMVWCLK